MEQSKIKSDILNAYMKFDKESAGKKPDYEKVSVKFTTAMIEIIMHLKVISENDDILLELTMQLLDICQKIQNRLHELSIAEKKRSGDNDSTN